MFGGFVQRAARLGRRGCGQEGGQGHERDLHGDDGWSTTVTKPGEWIVAVARGETGLTGNTSAVADRTVREAALVRLSSGAAERSAGPGVRKILPARYPYVVAL
ncbi:hypothetical protein GCM10010504_64520 [Streptomyces griseus]|nr:hypothetical protein GCM10010504_64520 [Streptomyces griseus]